jgi:hypothetical protein
MVSRVVTAVNLALLRFGLGSWSVAAALPLPPQVRLYQGLPYISGGVEAEARALLQTQSREYNVALTCAPKAGNSRAEIPSRQ